MLGRVARCAILLAGTTAVAAEGPAWRAVAEGVEYATYRFVDEPMVSDGLLHIVRIDADQAELEAVAAVDINGAKRTAEEWCRQSSLLVVTNAGMFHQDGSTHVGYMRLGQRVYSSAWTQTYNSILLFGPARPSLPGALLVDRDGDQSFDADYHAVIQNLRLIKGRGGNAWSKQGKRWSEAAIAIDARGRILFLFLRSPLSMWEFNDRLLKAPLGIERAMHVEGGPEASLSICSDGLSLHLAGSYETGFNENDDNTQQWPIPNVLGVKR